MLAIERHNRILQLLSEHGHVTTSGLCERLGASPATIRNDLVKLEKEGLIHKTHGGATLIPSPSGSRMDAALQSDSYRFKTREQLHGPEKQAISDKALEYIRDGQCIILDASSTALTLAKKLNQFSRLTVVTNGIYSMLALKDLPGITVILIGGIVTNNSGSVEGLLGSSMLNSIHADIGFVSAHGFTLKEGLTDFNIYETELKKLMLSRCKYSIALLDSSKLETVSTAGFCSSANIDVLMTDTKADPELLEDYRKHHVSVVTCPYA